MLVSRILLRTLRLNSLVPLLHYPFSKQRLIQYTPDQISHIHSKAQPKPLPFTKSTSPHYTVCLIGLPNSGKSTLYNCIIGDSLALTDHIPGMTRDRKQLFIWNGLLKLIDTAGVEATTSSQYHQDIMKQTTQAYNEADKILFVIDGKLGVNEGEMAFAKMLKKKGLIERVVLVVNKMENVDEVEVINEVGKLGFKEVMYTSGEHGDGVLELMQYIDGCIPKDMKERLERMKERRKENWRMIVNTLKEEIRNELESSKSTTEPPSKPTNSKSTLNPKPQPSFKFNFKTWQRQFKKLNLNPEQNSELDQQSPNLDNFIRPQQSFTKSRGVSDQNPMLKKPIQISIIGRPNVGKSSLINKLLGETRMVVSETANTTTDSIINEFEYQSRKIKLVDTAGLNSSNFDSNQEHLKKTQIAAMNHVKYSHVIIYMIDSNSSIKSLDFTFMHRIISEGRPIVIAINKWQTIKPEYRKKALAFINHQLDTHLGELNGAPIIPISAVMQQNIDKLMESVLKMYDQWNLRISTGMLNNWLEKFSKLDNLPKDGCENLKIRFVVQAKVRPPTFIVFVNNKELMKGNYQRFMKARMVEEFKLQGVPVRFVMKNAGGEEKGKRGSQKYKEYKKRKETMKGFERKQRVQDLKEKYGDFGKKE